MIFLSAFISVIIVSSLSLLGALFLVLKRMTFTRIITLTLAVSSGILLGSSFFDLIPESYKDIGETTYIFVVVGIVTFFVLEKFINWHHCVKGKDCNTQPAAYLSLIGDGIHNFLDGAIMAIAYLTNFSLGMTATLAVIAHEIPHELGDFSILIYAGFSSKKALLYNFLSGLTAVAGTVVIFVISDMIISVSPYLIGFAAGNFIYIAASDLIPELHHKRRPLTSFFQTVCIVSGVLIVWLMTRYIK